jgi:DNA-binding PadR family transcriptional regulator
VSNIIDMESIKPIDDNIQKKLSADVCSLLAMSQLENQGLKLSFENITMMAFRLFPSRFSLPNYPGYPDSHKIHESVTLHMQYTKGTGRHWAEGKPRQGYRITDQGRRELQRYQWVLGRRAAASALTRLSEREQKVLELIKASNAFKKYSARDAASITDEDVSFMLRFPVGEDPRKASQALERALEAAEKARDKATIELLRQVQSSHKKLFSYEGGSWKRRSL